MRHDVDKKGRTGNYLSVQLQTKSFRQKFFQLAGGSALAQGFSLLLMPVLSRLYDPEAFGVFAVYFATSTLVGTLATWRFDPAIVMAQTSEEAKHLSWLSSLLTLISTIVVGIIFFILSYFNYLPWLPASLIPITLVSILGVGLSQVLMYWHTREQNFGRLATRNVIERLFVLGIGIGLGITHSFPDGLIYAQFVGILLSVVYLSFNSGLIKTTTRFSWRKTFHSYIDWPKRNFFTTVLYSGSTYIMSFLFGSFYPKTQLGQFNLANRIFEAPATLIGNTFSAVYYQTTAQRDEGDRRRLFLKSLKILILLFAPPILLASVLAPTLFQYVFGDTWREAGTIAQWLGPLALFRLIFCSQASLFMVQRKLNIELMIAALMFVTQIVSFAIGHFLYKSLYMSIVYMSFSGCIVYILALFMIHSILPTTKKET